MQHIELSQGQVAIVDDDVYEYLCQWKWCATQKHSGGWYARRSKRVHETGPTQIYMHRVVYGYYHGQVEQQVDHFDQNTLNNTKDNLRAATTAQNNYNKAKISGTLTSKYKGVCWSNYRNKWQAYIRVNYKQQHLAFCETEEQAALLYNQRAVELFGKFASLNIVDPNP